MNDSVSEICRILELEGQALVEQAKTLRSRPEIAADYPKALVLMKSALEAGHKIILTGVGKSGKIAQKISATLASTGSFSVYLHPTEGLHGDLGIAQSGDVLIALSFTGNSEEICQLLPSLKEKKVSIIGMGGNPKSRLALQCDLWLQISVEAEACPHNLAPTTSTTLMLATGDALAITLMQMRGFDAASFAKNHPGGAIGKRLELRVSDLMHQGAALAQVSIDAPVDVVLMEATQKKLGAVAVIDQGEFKGLITEGDIRRALDKREKFFSLSAKDIMTKKPTTILETAMAIDALQLMENRPSQISVLPVMNTQGKCVGILRLHDLVKTL